jgi:hypothetical protein
MHKRTRGYTLLLLLVLTGLAGRLSTTTITSKERRVAIDELKQSKVAVLKSVKGLSEQQLNFKTKKHKYSIKEHLQYITLTEQSLWNTADNALKQPKQKFRIKLSDEKVLFLLNKNETEQRIEESIKQAKEKWKTTEEVLNAFKAKRIELIKFAKTSTDDMRNHVLQMPVGYIDSYQMLLYMAAHTKLHIRKIEELKADPAFPK